jgi:hypothetical protein
MAVTVVRPLARTFWFRALTLRRKSGIYFVAQSR